MENLVTPMIFTETKLHGAFIIDPEKRGDERGFFARTWCAKEFAAHGIPATMVQGNLSTNVRRGTLRGMHFQAAPHQEDKLVRCTKGAIYDVIVDLRPQSPTYRQWIGAELSAENYRMLFVPKDFAHGYQTLTDGAEVTYLVSAEYAPAAARGLRHDDPALGIDWPMPVTVISQADSTWPLLAEAEAAD